MELNPQIHQKSNIYKYSTSQSYFEHPYLPVFVLGLAAVQTILTSGFAYGWNALLLILKGEGKYKYLCKDIPGDAYCESEQLYLTQIFSIAYTLQYILGLPIGLLVDYLGPRCTLIGHSIIMIGFFGLATFQPSEDMSFDFNILFLIMIFCFRSFISTRSYHYANLFPKFFNLASTIISTSCMLSGGVFPLMYFIWVESQVSFKTILYYFIGIQSIFLIFCLVQPSSPIQFGEGIRFSLKKLRLEGYQKQAHCTLKAIVRAPDNSYQFAESSTLVTLDMTSFIIPGSPPSTNMNSEMHVQSYENNLIQAIQSSDMEDSKYIFNKTKYGDTSTSIQTSLHHYTKESFPNNFSVYFKISRLSKRIISEFSSSLNLLFNKLLIPSVVFNIWFFILTVYLQTANFIFYERSGDQGKSEAFSFIFSCMIPLGFTGSLLIAFLGDYITPKAMLLSYCILGIVFLLINLMPFSHFYLVAFILYAIIEDAMYAQQNASISYLSDPKKFCGIMGLFYSICGITAILAGSMSSLLISRAISTQTLLYIFLAIGICSIILGSKFKLLSVKNK